MGEAPQEERTELASDRTLLASERTLAAWWRTVLAALAAAVGLVRIYGDVQPAWLARAAASAAILFALLMLFMGARRYTRTATRVESASIDRVPRVELWLGTALLLMLAAAAAVIVWSEG